MEVEICSKMSICSARGVTRALVRLLSPGIACRICVFCWSSGWRKSLACNFLRCAGDDDDVVEDGASEDNVARRTGARRTPLPGRRGGPTLPLPRNNAGLVIVVESIAVLCMVARSLCRAVGARDACACMKRRKPEESTFAKNGHVGAIFLFLFLGDDFYLDFCFGLVGSTVESDERKESAIIRDGGGR